MEARRAHELLTPRALTSARSSVNLFVTDDKNSLPQITGGAKPEDREDITNLEVKVLLGKP